MFTKVTIRLLLASTVLVLAAEQTEATYLRNILHNGQNDFEDQDRDVLVDVNSDGQFNTGDVLLGFVRLDDQTSTGGVGPLNDRVYSIFTQQVLSADTVSGSVVFTETTAAGLTLADLTGAATPGGGVTAIYSGPAITDLINTSPGDLTGDTTINIFDYFAEITSNQTLSVVAGFGGQLTQSDDFFNATVDPTFLAPAALTQIPTLTTSLSVGSFDAGLSILFNADDPHVTYNEDVPTNASGGGLTFHDLIIGAPGSIRGAVGAANSAEWTSITPDLGYDNPGGFITNADFFVNTTVVVPEPGSVAMFGLGSLVLLGAGYRRRRRSSCSPAQ